MYNGNVTMNYLNIRITPTRVLPDRHIGMKMERIARQKTDDTIKYTRRKLRFFPPQNSPNAHETVESFYNIKFGFYNWKYSEIDKFLH